MTTYERCLASLYSLVVLEGESLHDTPAGNAIRRDYDAAWQKATEDERASVRRFAEERQEDLIAMRRRIPDRLKRELSDEKNLELPIANTYVCEKCKQITIFDYLVLAHERLCMACRSELICKFRVKDAIEAGWKPSTEKALFLSNWKIPQVVYYPQQDDDSQDSSEKEKQA